jgi:broad specificity phosphatase PhoE
MARRGGRRFYSRRPLILLLLLVASCAAECSEKVDAATVFLVRHAEKQIVGDDPGLTAAGRERAVELARLLQNTSIDAIYSTDFARTRETAAPLADRLAKPIRIYDWEQQEDLAAEMVREGGRYLVVGHSNTTPELVQILGGEPGPPIDERLEHDRLYIVRIGPGGVTTELRRYGKP